MLSPLIWPLKPTGRKSTIHIGLLTYSLQVMIQEHFVYVITRDFLIKHSVAHRDRVSRHIQMNLKENRERSSRKDGPRGNCSYQESVCCLFGMDA